MVIVDRVSLVGLLSFRLRSLLRLLLSLILLVLLRLLVPIVPDAIVLLLIHGRGIVGGPVVVGHRMIGRWGSRVRGVRIMHRGKVHRRVVGHG